MRVYLVQHGDALDKSVDPERPLSPQGKADVRTVAVFLENKLSKVKQVRHSGKPRARQTAEILAQHAAPQAKVVETPGLGPQDPVEPVRKDIEKHGGDLMLVGHMPFMGRLAGLLVCGDESAEPVVFKKGGVVCLENAEGDAWAVHWYIPPELVR